jgi:hypothetical protein
MYNAAQFANQHQDEIIAGAKFGMAHQDEISAAAKFGENFMQNSNGGPA